MPLTTNSQSVPVKIVGSSVFGRYPTISDERTYNMYISSSGDEEEQWLVNFPGYASRQRLSLSNTLVGRGLFRSVRGGFVISVVGSSVYLTTSFETSSFPVLLGSMDTEEGEVFIDENLSSQICIVDGQKAYIYNYAESEFGEVNFDSHGSDFLPNYVVFQNTYFIFGNGNQTNTGNQWFIYESGYTGSTMDALDLNYLTNLSLQTKPDYAVAATRIPGAANTLLVFGTTVSEIWTQVPTSQIYQRNQSVNIDYGCISVSTIAFSDNLVVWLGVNEQSSPSIMVSQGGPASRISSDGIDFLMDEINFPDQSTAFFVREDGHLFYVLTFYNEADNLTICYDFTTKKFFDLTDWDNSFFPARQVIYFDKNLYFISLKDSSIYELDSSLTTYEVFRGLQEYEIPRMRKTNTFRLPTPEKFRINVFTFFIESGTTPDVSGTMECTGYILTEEGLIIYDEDGLPIMAQNGTCDIYRPRIDLTISKNGGITYSNTVSYYLHDTAHYRAQPRFDRLGRGNQITMQLRFWTKGRMVIKNGAIEVSP